MFHLTDFVPYEYFTSTIRILLRSRPQYIVCGKYYTISRAKKKTAETVPTRQMEHNYTCLFSLLDIYFPGKYIYSTIILVIFAMKLSYFYTSFAHDISIDTIKLEKKINYLLIPFRYLSKHYNTL